VLRLRELPPHRHEARRPAVEPEAEPPLDEARLRLEMAHGISVKERIAFM
jgi:hypothetical protein